MCALFGGNRDSGFLRGINMELLHSIISTEVLIFKISHTDTVVNIYGEANDRRYMPGVRTFAKITAEDKVAISDDSNIDFNKNIIFSFIKADLKNQNIFLEEGDIIQYDDTYFEVDNVNDGKYWFNRNPNTDIGMTRNNRQLHGYDYTIICETHQTKRSVLNLEDDVRIGEPVQEYIQPSIPKFL